MQMKKLMTIFLLSSICFGIGFWLLWGHDLSYEVYSSANNNSVLWYSEAFSRQGRIIISCVVGILVGAGSAAARWLISGRKNICLIVRLGSQWNSVHIQMGAFLR